MVVPLFSTLVLSVVIARRLGPAALGQQSVISYVGALVSGVVIAAVTNCSIQAASSANGANDFGRLESLRRLSGRAHVVAGLACAGAVVAMGLGRAYALAWGFMALTVLLDACGWAHGSRIVALRGWHAVSPMRLVSQLASSLVGVAAVLFGAGIVGVFAAQALSSAALLMGLRWRDRGLTVPRPATLSPLSIRQLARLWGLFLVSMLLGQIVDKRVELLFLDAYRSAHEVAVYAVAFSLVTVAVTVPASLAGAMVPGIAAVESSSAAAELPTHLYRAARLANVSALVLTAGLMSIGPAAILVIWGPELNAAASILPWMAASVLFLPVRALYGAYWTGVGRLSVALVSSGVAAAVDLGLAWLLVPDHGVGGAVAANLAAQVVGCWLITRVTRARVKGDHGHLGDLVRPAIVCAGAGGAAAAVTALLPGLVGLVAGTVLFVALLAGLSAVIGLVAAQDGAWLAGALPRAAAPVVAIAVGRQARSSAGTASGRTSRTRGST
jgi:O-antigen/teichoic acid export membrane protein